MENSEFDRIIQNNLNMVDNGSIMIKLEK